MKLKLFQMSLLMITLNVMSQQLPAHVELQELGISFDIPAGWSGYVEGEAIVMGHESIAGLMIMTENKARSLAELKQLAQQGMAEQNIQLNPKGEFQAVGNNRLEGFYQGTFNGESVKSYALALIDLNGKGVTILSLTTAGQFTQRNRDEANKLAASVKFYQAVDSVATTAWKQKIAGRQLKYMRTSGSSDYDGGYTGSSDRTTIGLCADSTFYYSSSSMANFDSSSGSGYAANQGNNQGSYEIYSVGEQSYLSLNFNQGNNIEFALTINQQGNTFLDGSRYFASDLASCD
jgi:hypothetical protein